MTVIRLVVLIFSPHFPFSYEIEVNGLYDETNMNTIVYLHKEVHEIKEPKYFTSFKYDNTHEYSDKRERSSYYDLRSYQIV